MAAQNLTSFLIFPTLSREYVWKIVATESKRTISRHKLLENAVQKAERLNFQAFLAEMPRVTTCEAYISSQYGAECQELAVVSDIESEREFCLDCFGKLERGTL